MPTVVTRLFELGAVAWPGIDLDPERFSTHVRERAADEASAAALHAADLYLACACATGHPRAIAAFESRYIPEIPLFLTGVERSPEAIEEVKQLVRERLFVAAADARPKILEYSGRGSLGSWLRVVTLRVSSNRRRGDKKHAPIDGEAATTELLPAVDAELAIIRTRYKGAFNEALRTAFSGLSPRERVVFRMHFVDGLNIDRIGIVFKVHRATVARWIATAREGLVERTMALVGERLEVPKSELASLLRVVRESLDVSLHALLVDDAP